MTQKQLAIRSYITQPYISDLEKGIVRKKSPTLKVIEDLAEALKICPFLLLKCNRRARCTECKYFENFFCKTIRHDVITNIHHNAFLIKFYKRWFRVAGQKLTIYMNPELIKDLKKVAIDEDTSVSQILSKLAIEYVKNAKNKNN